jgi:hypothetical protein
VPKRKTAIGRYAKGQMEGLKMAEALQAIAVAAIKEDFAAEDEEEITLERLEFKSYITELQAAVSNDTVQEFEEKYRRLLIPILSQAMQQAQQAQGGQG